MARKRNLDYIFTGKTKCSCCGKLKDNTNFPYYSNQFYNKGSDNPLTGTRKRSNTNCCDCRKKKQKERAAIKKKFKDLKPPKFGKPCELCEKPVDANWQLDHCHETGNFRGWLCKGCNTGLGLLGDTVSDLKKAVEYLTRANKGKNPSQKNLY